MNAKRKKAEKSILSVVSDIDSSGRTAKTYKEAFERMNDKEFDSYMKALKNGKEKLFVFVPNMDNDLTINKIIELCDKYGVKIRSKVWRTHKGRKFLTNNKYLILNLPVRRVKQYLYNKISLPSDDRTVGMITGQPIGASKGSKISAIETTILSNKQIDDAIIELIKVRGGDVRAYQEMKNKILEDGSVNLSELNLDDSIPKSVISAAVLFKAMMLENNLAGE